MAAALLPGGGTTPGTNPCTTALLADTAEVAAVGSVAQAGGATSDKKTIVDGDPRGRVYEALALHKDAVARREAKARTALVQDDGTGAGRTAITAPAPVGEDVGDIAVIQDTGDLILPQNAYDVRSTGLRFTRNGASYTLSHIDGNFRTALGNRVTLVGRRQRRREHPVLVSLLRHRPDRRVRQLRRQHHLRRRGQVEHRAQRRAAADRAAARRAVLRRSRSDDRQRQASSSTRRRISTPSRGATCAASTRRAR